jgi:hypothetical protein
MTVIEISDYAYKATSFHTMEAANAAMRVERAENETEYLGVERYGSGYVVWYIDNGELRYL